MNKSGKPLSLFINLSQMGLNELEVWESPYTFVFKFKPVVASIVSHRIATTPFITRVAGEIPDPTWQENVTRNVSSIENSEMCCCCCCCGERSLFLKEAEGGEESNEILNVWDMWMNCTCMMLGCFLWRKVFHLQGYEMSSVVGQMQSRKFVSDLVSGFCCWKNMSVEVVEG